MSNTLRNTSWSVSITCCIRRVITSGARAANSGVNQRSLSVSSTGAMPLVRMADTTPRTFALSSSVRNAAVL